MGPFTTELVNEDEFEHVVAGIVKRSGMYVEDNNYHAVTAYISGLERGALIGLHQWLVVRLDGFNNTSWQASIPASSNELGWPLKSESDHKHAIELLGQTLAEFFDYRREVGLTKIFFDYGNWLLSQDWYTGPLREQK